MRLLVAIGVSMSDSFRCVGHSRWRRSANPNPGQAIAGDRASASTLKSSPISAGARSFCTGAAALMYASEFGRTGRGQGIQNSTADEERRLRGVPRNLESAAFARCGHRGEIDVRGDVGETRPCERVVVRTMTVMTHQRSPAALRMVILGGRKSVVDEQRRTRHQPSCNILDERLGPQVDLARVVVDGREACRRERSQRAVGRTLGPGEASRRNGPRQRRARATCHCVEPQFAPAAHRALRSRPPRRRLPREARRASRQAKDTAWRSRASVERCRSRNSGLTSRNA